MSALDKLYLRCLTLEKQILEHEGSEPGYQRKTNPSQFMGEFDEPEHVTGETITAQLEAALDQLAAVNPELGALRSSVFSREALQDSARKWDRLRAEEDAQREENTQSARELREKLNHALEQYEKAGGPIYDIRINLDMLDEAFFTEVLTAIRADENISEQSGRLCAKALAGVFEPERLKAEMAHIRDVLFLPATEDHPTELGLNNKVSKHFWDGILGVAKKDLSELLDKHGAFVQADQKARLLKALDLIHPVNQFNVSTMRLGDAASHYPSYHGSRALALIPDHLPKLHQSIRYEKQDREASLAIVNQHLTQARNRFLSQGGKLSIG